MSFHLPALVVPAALAGMLSLALAGYVSQRQRSVFDTRGITVHLVAAGLSSLLFVPIYLLPRVETMLFLLNVGLTLTVVGLLGLFHFSLVFADRRDVLTPWTAGGLGLCTVAFVVAMFTDRFHGTFRSDVVLYTEPVRVVSTSYGPTGGLCLLYMLSLVVASAYAMLSHLVRSEMLHRTPGLLVATAIVLPVCGSLLNVLEWPHPAANTIPIFIAVSGLFYTVGIAKYDFLNVVPLAHEEVVESIDDCLFVTNPDGRVIMHNDVPNELLEQGDAVDRHIDEVLPLDDARSRPDGGAEAAEWRTELTVEEDDEQRTYDLRSVPVYARDDRLLGRALTLRDVTERRRREERLRRKNERLDEFASMVSHDLRNPLNVAQIRADLVDDEENAAAITDALDRMETMVEQLLRLARAGQDVEGTQECNLDAIATAAWGNIRAGESTLRIDDEEVTIQADSTRLLQTFENLFRNAIDHNDRPVTVRVGGLEHTAGFYVADDGDGLPDDSHDSIFEQGYTTSADGSGLGLAIVHDIVDAHGWTITVVEEGKGARFEVHTD